MVFVKKSKGKWRMYMDFTNMNKECTNDNFPLPCINMILDSMVGHCLLSFIDAYLWYNQIDKLHWEDIFHHGLRPVLLLNDAIKAKECEHHLLGTSELDV